MSNTVAPLRFSGIAPEMYFHLTLGKSPRKCRGAVFTPNRLMLWNHSPSSSMRWARATRSTSPVLFCPASAMVSGSPAFCRGVVLIGFTCALLLGLFFLLLGRD